MRGAFLIEKILDFLQEVIKLSFIKLSFLPVLILSYTRLKMIETISQAAGVDVSLPQELRHYELSPSEQLAFRITEKLKPIAGVESAWLEDLGKTVYVHVIINSFRNATLHPIFAGQYDLESEFDQLTFHFDINPVDLEEMQISNRIQRLF